MIEICTFWTKFSLIGAHRGIKPSSFLFNLAFSLSKLKKSRIECYQNPPMCVSTCNFYQMDLFQQMRQLYLMNFRFVQPSSALAWPQFWSWRKLNWHKTCFHPFHGWLYFDFKLNHVRGHELTGFWLKFCKKSSCFGDFTFVKVKTHLKYSVFWQNLTKH